MPRATPHVVKPTMKPTDETPGITPDEPIDDTSNPLPGVQPEADEIPEGIDTEPESTETGPNTPGQPQKSDVVDGI